MARLTWMFLLLAAAELVSSENDLCPDNLVKNEFLQYFQGNCYQFVLNDRQDWYMAEAKCVSQGGHLTDVQTFSEQGFLYNNLQIITQYANDKDVWIGLTDEHNEGTWQWSNGVDLTFENWADGQPGVLSGSEDCVVYKFSDHGQWHDYPCHGNIFGVQKHGWICKYKAQG